MSKGFDHRGDPDIAPDEFLQASDGKHVVNGIDYLSTDDSGYPIFKEVLGELKVTIKFRKPDDSIPPVATLTFAELMSLSEVFGVNLDIPYSDRLYAETLLKIQDAINESSKTTTVESKGGFVKTSFHPPTGLYVVQFKDAYRPDHEPGNLNFQKTDKRDVLIVEFEIVGDAKGKPCKYNGFPILWWAPNVFISSWSEMDEDGNETVHECDMPTFDRTTAGGIPKDATRWEKFAEYFAPATFEHEWERNALKSSFGIDEVANPQYVILGEAKKVKKKVLVGTSLNKDGRFIFDLFDNVFGSDIPSETALERVVNYLEKVSEDITLFQLIELPDTLTLTEEGIEWMKEYVAGEAGPWARAGLPTEEGKRSLLLLSEEQCEALLTELKKTFVKGF